MELKGLGYFFIFLFFLVLWSDRCFRVLEIASGFWGFVRIRYWEVLVYRGVSIKREWFFGYGSGLGTRKCRGRLW